MFSSIGKTRLRTQYMVLIFCIFISISTASAREIAFLPAYVTGEAPDSLRKKGELSSGIAELSSWYVTENFMAYSTDQEKVRQFVDETEEVREKKPSKRLISGACVELDSDYIARSEIEFSESPTILTEVFNCRGSVIAKQEDVLEGNFYKEMEKHIKKTFSFLAKKQKSNQQIVSESEEEILVALDLSGSNSREAGELISFLQSILGTKGLSLGIILIKTKGTEVILPSTKHEKLKDALSRVNFSGELDMESLSVGLAKARKSIGSSDSTKKTFILVTDAKMPKEGSINYQSVISGFARMGYNVNIIIGTVFEHQDISAHRKAASGSGGNLYQLIFYQKIGTMKEYKTLILNNRSIYIDPSNTMKPSSDDFKNLAKIDEGRIYAKYSFASPENMAEIYNDFYGEKILEKGKIISNLRVNLEKLFYSKEISGRKDLPKVLIKSGKDSFWVYVKKANESILDKNIAIRAVFIKNSRESVGFSSIGDETEVETEQNFPGLLVLTPGEIRNYLKEQNRLNCYVKGFVLEIK